MWTIKLIEESDKAAIFSPLDSNSQDTEFEKFMSNHSSLTEPQLKYDFDAIISAIGKILNDCGARENLFRPEGNRVKALPLWAYQKGKVQKYEDDPNIKSIVELNYKLIVYEKECFI